MRTVQAPHSLLEQPGLVPVSFKSFLRTSRSVELAATLSSCSRPFALNEMTFEATGAAEGRTDPAAVLPDGVPRSHAEAPVATAAPPTKSFKKFLLEILKGDAEKEILV